MDKSIIAQRGRGFREIKGKLAIPLMELEAAYQEQIVDSAFEDTELREHIYHRIRLLIKGQGRALPAKPINAIAMIPAIIIVMPGP